MSRWKSTDAARPPNPAPTPAPYPPTPRPDNQILTGEGSLDEVGELAEQGRLRFSPDDLLDDLAAREQVDGRDRHDSVLDHRLRILVGVDLDDVHAARVLGRDRVEHRADLSAGAAPRRPVLDDHRPGAGQHIGIEDLIGNFP